MKIVLFGCSDVSLSVLEFLKSHQYDLVAIVTQKENFSISYQKKGVKNVRHADLLTWGKEQKIPTFFYETAIELIPQLESLKPDLGLVVGWYHKVPEKVRNLFPKGCLGFHASLLPQLRGGAPLNWAILKGFTETGVSCFELSEGVDDGLLYGQKKIKINPEDDVGTLVISSQECILELLQELLPALSENRAHKKPQMGVPSYTGQRIFEDGWIDWHSSVSDILKLIRATSRPYSGAYFYFNDVQCFCWKACAASVLIYGVPGQIHVIEGHVFICSEDGAIEIQEVTDGAGISCLPELLKANHQRCMTEKAF